MSIKKDSSKQNYITCLFNNQIIIRSIAHDFDGSIVELGDWITIGDTVSFYDKEKKQNISFEVKSIDISSSYANLVDKDHIQYPLEQCKKYYGTYTLKDFMKDYHFYNRYQEMPQKCVEFVLESILSHNKDIVLDERKIEEFIYDSLLDSPYF